MKTLLWRFNSRFLKTPPLANRNSCCLLVYIVRTLIQNLASVVPTRYWHSLADLGASNVMWKDRR